MKTIGVLILSILLLGGCSSNKAETAVTPAPASTQESKTADYWTVIDGATWSDDYEGLKTTVKKIVVSDKVPTSDGATTSVVGVKFNIENTTKETFSTFPDQATLVTSTGEQIDADLMQSDDLGGEIYEGVTKEGNVNFFLKNGHAEDIKWITLKWYVKKGESMGDGERKNYDVKIEF